MACNTGLVQLVVGKELFIITLEEIHEIYQSKEFEYFVDNADYTTYQELLNKMVNCNALTPFNYNAWVLPNGMVFTCGWAQHERLLKLFNIEVADIEKEWARVSCCPNYEDKSKHSSVQLIGKPTKAQLRVLHKYCLELP